MLWLPVSGLVKCGVRRCGLDFYPLISHPGEARERSRGSDLGVVLPILVALESLLASSPPSSKGICQGPDFAHPFLTECSVAQPA